MEYWDKIFKWTYNDDCNLYRPCLATDQQLMNKKKKQFSKNLLKKKIYPTKQTFLLHSVLQDVPSVANNNAEILWLLQLYSSCRVSNRRVFSTWTSAQAYSFLRPSSDVVLLPCRTKLQFGSTVARQEINSDSDVVPESNQIQGLLKARNNSPPNSPRERNLARTY